MTNQQVLQTALRQCAVNSSCAPEDFLAATNKVVISKPHSEASRYLRLPFFCDLTTFGSCVVASVDQRVAAFVQEFIDSHAPGHCFETPAVHLLTREFAQYGYTPCFMAEYWLPDVDILAALPCAYRLRVVQPADFAALYTPVWANALCADRKPLDVLAVGAYDGDTLVGLAGCSADSDTMWQIGVDVLPGYRRQGIAAALTSRLAVETLQRGKVPYYCCAWANVRSAKNAIKSCFRPAWMQHTSIETGRVEKMLARG